MKIYHVAALLSFAPALATVSVADEPARHPAYIHALQDLRAARGYLDRLSPDDKVDDQEMHAIKEIEAAIGKIKRASIDDGKDMDDHPPIDAHIKRTDRFHKAVELLDKARRDVRQEEDDPDSRGLQQRALGHISEAERTVKHAIETRLNE